MKNVTVTVLKRINKISFSFFLGPLCVRCVLSTISLLAFHSSILTFVAIPTQNNNMSPSKTSGAENAAAEALQKDQAAFHKHLQELSAMVKEIETKLKPTIKK